MLVSYYAAGGRKALCQRVSLMVLCGWPLRSLMRNGVMHIRSYSCISSLKRCLEERQVMKAIQFNTFGSTSVLEYTDLAMPSPLADQVLINEMLTFFSITSSFIKSLYEPAWLCSALPCAQTHSGRKGRWKATLLILKLCSHRETFYENQ